MRLKNELLKPRRPFRRLKKSSLSTRQLSLFHGQRLMFPLLSLLNLLLIVRSIKRTHSTFSNRNIWRRLSFTNIDCLSNLALVVTSQNVSRRTAMHLYLMDFTSSVVISTFAIMTDNGTVTSTSLKKGFLSLARPDMTSTFGVITCPRGPTQKSNSTLITLSLRYLTMTLWFRRTKN